MELVELDGFLGRGLEVVPGQGAVGVDVAMGVEGWVEAGVFDGAVVVVGMEGFFPGVESRAEFPGVLEGGADASVAAGEDGFDAASVSVVEADLDVAFSAGGVSDDGLGAIDVVEVTLADPLERGVGFGGEDGDRDVDVGCASGDLSAELGDVVGEFDDAGQLVGVFAGQSDHEVEFDVLPAALVGAGGGVEDGLVVDGFVDDLSDEGVGGFDGDGEGGFADAAGAGGDEFELFFGAEGGEGDADVSRSHGGVEVIEELSEFGMVG